MPNPPIQRAFPLLADLRVSYARAGANLLDAVREVLSEQVPKRVVLAEDIGITEQHLSDALKGNGKHFAATWLPAVVRYDREHVIATEIAAWQGLRVQERAPMSDREWRRRVDAALRRAGAAGEAIRIDALRDEDEP